VAAAGMMSGGSGSRFGARFRPPASAAGSRESARRRRRETAP
jgi:hypothetical protein